ncbi:hypothetical protein C6Q21_26720 [Burkholderia multivorans]|nr:hypothetical protein C6Q21_26720 [Burkholderia multivorans]
MPFSCSAARGARPAPTRSRARTCDRRRAIARLRRRGGTFRHRSMPASPVISASWRRPRSGIGPAPRTDDAP